MLNRTIRLASSTPTSPWGPLAARHMPRTGALAPTKQGLNPSPGWLLPACVLVPNVRLATVTDGADVGPDRHPHPQQHLVSRARGRPHRPAPLLTRQGSREHGRQEICVFVGMPRNRHTISSEVGGELNPGRVRDPQRARLPQIQPAPLRPSQATPRWLPQHTLTEHPSNWAAEGSRRPVWCWVRGLPLQQRAWILPPASSGTEATIHQTLLGTRVTRTSHGDKLPTC